MSASPPIFVLGGHQTDFARHWTREGLAIADVLHETASATLEDAAVEPAEVEVVHVGNFAAERYVDQGHLGALAVEADPGLHGLPSSRHEAACASGSVAILAAMADLQAGRYDVALVVGAEIMRSMGAVESQQVLAAAAWVPREVEGLTYPWPHLFSGIVAEYDRRYGIDHQHLGAIAALNMRNGARNPRAQTRSWQFDDVAFGDDDEHNPVMAGSIRRQDCSQLTDGGAGVVLASPAFAAEWSRRRGISPATLPQITGWGQRTARMTAADMLADSRHEPYVLPEMRRAFLDGLGRAGLAGVDELDLLECHDCFSITEYAIIDHIGLTQPGESWKAVESGAIEPGGALPINPSGGLIGCGHPVGATGVRMVLDLARQVTGTAGEVQVEGARRGASLNVGGSATTAVTFVVERPE